MKREKSHAIIIRLEHRSRSGTASDVRHDLRRGKVPNYVDPARTSLNSILLDGPTPAAMRAECVRRRDLQPRQRVMRTSAAVSARLLIGWGKGIQPAVRALGPEQQDALYTEVAEALAARLGTALVALVVHRDETAPHAHGRFHARTPSGDPLSKLLRPTVMSELQDIATEVAQRHLPGVRRGTPKSERLARGDDASAIYNRRVRQLHVDLPMEIAALEEERNALVAEVDSLSARACADQTAITEVVRTEAEIRRRVARGERALTRCMAQVSEAGRRQAAIEVAAHKLLAEIKLLRPASDAARALEAACLLDPGSAAEAWERILPPHPVRSMAPRPRQLALISWAAAIRLCDPWFAPELDVQRSHDPHANLRLLTGLGPKMQGALGKLTLGEPGALEAVAALDVGRVVRRQDGVVEVSIGDPEDARTVAMWIDAAWAGVRRGHAAANGTAPGDVALAAVVGTLPLPTRRALEHLLRVQAAQGAVGRDEGLDPTPPEL